MPSHHKYRKRSRSRSPSKHHFKREKDDDRSKDVRERRKRSADRDGHRHKKGSHNNHDSPGVRVKQEPRDDGYDRSEGGRDWQRQQADRRHNDRRRHEDRKHKPQNPFKTESEQFEFGTSNSRVKKEEAEADKQKPDFKLSGKLTEDTNTFKGVVIKYNEPVEARKPKRRWRWYPLKGDETLPVLHLHRQSAFLLGRDRRVADIPTDHPSCSKQHAVLQFRMVEFERADGSTGRRVRPYIIDLDSGNGTFLNGKKIESQRYVELKEKDVVKFGFSSREYVLLHDATDTSVVEDDSE